MCLILLRRLAAVIHPPPQEGRGSPTSVSKQEVRSQILFSLLLHTNSTRTTSSVCVTFV